MPHKDWSDVFQSDGSAAIKAQFEAIPESPDGTDGTGGTTAHDGASSRSAIREHDGTGGTLSRPSFGVYLTTVERDGKTFGPGVWFHGSKGEDDFDKYVCSPLIVDAITSSDEADFGRLVKFIDSLGRWKEWAMPMPLLAGSGETMRAEFLNLGAEIDPDAHRLLNRYIQSQRPDRQVIAATSTGWHSPDLFIMPRRNIGSGDAIYQSEAANADDYRQDGSLDAWKAEIGQRCDGNPVLMLAVCIALSGPLLYHLNRQGGGFHLEGDSSTGKTTALSVAASVWGNPDQFTRTWRGTSNGYEGIASQRNDGLLPLDEIGEALPKEVSNTVYLLANGAGKSRATKTGAARPTRRWRVMVLSTGELSLDRHMQESGQRARAGQEIRLLSVSARRHHGAWENLHGLDDGRALSDALQKSAATHYGHAGPLFVEKLIESGEADKLPDMLATLVKRFPASSGQEARAAERFAIAALAGELAIKFGILDVASGAPTEAMVTLFEDWRDRRGSGQSEDTKILGSISDYLTRHGDSQFSELGDTSAVRDRAGWWKNGADGRRVWLFTSEGLHRAAPGYEVRRIADALESAGWLAERGSSERAKKVRVNKGRPVGLYHVQEVEQ